MIRRKDDDRINDDHVNNKDYDYNDDDDYGGDDRLLSKKLTNENVQESDFVSKACCYVQSIRMDCDAGKDCNKSRITSSSELEPT